MAAVPRFADFNALAAKLAEAVNGVGTYSAERVIFGFLNANQYLKLTPELDGLMPNALAGDVNMIGQANAEVRVLGQQGDTFRANNPMNLLLDAQQMAVAGTLNLVSNDKAGLYVATLRARWLALGCFTKDLAARCVTYDEYKNDAVAPTEEEKAAYLTLNNQHPEVVDFCIKYAENIWAICEFFFRVRGHHYKEQYKDLADRLWEAVTESEEKLAADFPYVDVFRTAIHPFGVKALPVHAYRFIAHGKVANALIIRFSGAPNGTAAITTAAAGLAILASEAWYSRFAQQYKEAIDYIKATALQINNAKYSVHMSARLYGVDKRVTFENGAYTIETAMKHVAAIAPVLKGFKDAMGKRYNNVKEFSFLNAASLNKHAASNPLMAARIGELIEFAVAAVASQENIGKATEAAFPVVQMIE